MKSFCFLDLTTTNVFIYSDVLKRQKMIYKVQGWEFALWFFERIVRFLWVKERNSDLLFSKERIPIFLFFKERREQIAPVTLWKRAVKRKKWKSSEKLSKTWWKLRIFWANRSFFIERIACLFFRAKEQLLTIFFC